MGTWAETPSRFPFLGMTKPKCHVRGNAIVSKRQRTHFEHLNVVHLALEEAVEGQEVVQGLNCVAVKDILASDGGDHINAIVTLVEEAVEDGSNTVGNVDVVAVEDVGDVDRDIDVDAIPTTGNGHMVVIADVVGIDYRTR